MAEVQNSALDKRIKKHVIGKPHRFMAVAPLGFEETLAEELKYIGVEVASDGTSEAKHSAGASGLNCTANTSSENCAAGIKVAGDGKVEFTAKITEAWKAVAYSRIANRILMEIGSFKAENFGQLEKGTAAVPWELFLGNCANLELHVSCRHSRLYHSGAIEERVAPIIAKALADSNSDSYPQNLYINLQDDRCTLWLDLAGEELYKRGHERFVAEAPLKETIAAAMIFEAVRLQALGSRLQVPGILTTNHQPLTTTIVDPMAGSGTFSLEAAYIAYGLIPGKCRDFALKHQPAFKNGTWNFILKSGIPREPLCHSRESENLAVQKNFTSAIQIITSDISERPVSIIKHNAEASPLAEIAKKNPNAVIINPQQKDFFSYTSNDIPEGSIILLNPPYGKRLTVDAPKLYAKIGQKLNELKGNTIAILVPTDCIDSLIKFCSALDFRHTETAKAIKTSHGGINLYAIFAQNAKKI